MKDFEDQINQSFRKFREGDLVTGTVVSVNEEEITLDMNTYSGGYIKAVDYSNDPAFHAMDEIRIGEEIRAVVMDASEGQGRVRLSLKAARENDAWEVLKEALSTRKIYEVKVSSAVNGGVIAYIEGMRGFIPASLLALEYVENLEDYVGKTLRVIVVTAEQEDNKLVLSAKDVAKEEAAKIHEGKLNALQKGFVAEGVIERIENYGCFVRFGEDLTGLVHISQICGKFLKSPNEVVKLGQTVKVKVLDVAEGKIRLSMKEAEDLAPDMADEEEVHMEYSDDGEATTSLASLLANLDI